MQNILSFSFQRSLEFLQECLQDCGEVKQGCIRATTKCIFRSEDRGPDCVSKTAQETVRPESNDSSKEHSLFFNQG